ncbi:amino acid ABC transporter permease [Paeniglutamicibacter sp. ZC-3]|uniref:amino acid ABC transporter permease n=1 Tax=Paeniglutamicibacter TaxID=1742990 RepID=UPI0021F70917|nr:MULTISPECIES: amino acid ABC transporter permease [Paeniglutamicibacter]MCV9993210.1 amino acid ABC transporter permease [Paeniglutamicibacter sp. ZC-3]MDO2933436.1 amino acid ABC transporter permease [Paeniglutamicibacter sulfureus]
MTTRAPEPRENGLVIVPARYLGRWIAAVAVVGILLILIYSMFANERFHWDVVGEYLFAKPVLAGLGRTLMLTAISMLIGIVLGIVVAVCRLSANPILSTAAWAYSWFFRGTPLMVQLLFWFFLAALIPNIGLGIPFGPELLSIDTNSVISPFTAALLGLSLNEGAYMGEIVRSGIRSIATGQTEAAKAIGMSRMQTMRRVILPQAMRVIIPPTGNETIGMLKYTSLVIVIGYSELLTSVSIIYSRNFQTIPLLIVAAIWYLAVTAVLSVGQYFIERHFERGFSPIKGKKPAAPAASATGPGAGPKAAPSIEPELEPSK